MTDDIKSLNYEAAHAQLQELVARLESGELSLEDTVALYERGNRLAAHCQSLLEDAQLRIRRIDEDDASGTLL